MKRCLKIFFILLVMVHIIVLFQSVVFAMPDPASAVTWGGNASVMNATQNVSGAIVQIIQTVGVGVAVIMIIFVAIKYMTAAPSEKAEFKKSATAYIVGAIVLFAGTQILGIIYNFSTNISN